MKTNACILTASLTVLLSLASFAAGQVPGGMGYPMQSPIMPISYPAPVMTANYGPLANPAAPTVATGSGVTAGSKEDCGSCKSSKGDCGPSLAIYGDFLFLRARDAEVAYADVVNGAIVPPPNFPIQISPVGVVDMDHQPGFRFGFRYNTDQCNAIGAEYPCGDGSTQDQVITTAPTVVRSIVSHPGTSTAAQDFLVSTAEYDLSHDIVDANYYSLLSCDDAFQLTGVFGIRALQHEQNLHVSLAGSGTETVLTDIDFYGVGARAGFEFDKFISSQWLVYAKGYGSLVPGEFRADYDQRQSYDTLVVDTGWKAGRLVTIWDLEMGLSWISKCGNYRLNVGYVYSAWTNMVQTDEWIDAVQQNNFIDMDSTMTYDGLVGRMEVRY